MTMSPQQNPLPPWIFLLSQKQEFLDNRFLDKNPITPDQQGKFEMKEEVLASAGVQDMVTSGYELSDLEDQKFLWENPQLELDAVSTRVDTPFSPTSFNDLEIED